MTTTPPPLPSPPSFPAEVQKASVKFITTEAVNALLEHPSWGPKGPAGALLDFLKAFTVQNAGLALRALVETTSLLGEAQMEIESKSQDILYRAAATGLNDLFGTNIQPAQLKGAGATGGGSAASHVLGDAVFRALFGALEHPAAPQPEVGLENAKRILEFNLSTALEGWLMGVVEAIPYLKDLPSWADLDDVMQQALGLGRMNRRALGPVLDALVVRPLEQYFRREYLDALPTKEEAAQLLLDGGISEAEYFDFLARRGYKREWAAIWRKAGTKKLSEGDIATALEVGQLTEAAALEQLRGLGYSDETARLKLKVLELERLRTVNNQFVSTALDMFRDREIDLPRFTSLVRATGAAPAVVEAFEGLGNLQRARPRGLERGVMERAYRDGLITLNRLHAFYVAEGYSLEDTFLLEALAIQARLEAEKKRETEPAPGEEEEEAALPRGVAEELYRRGLIGEAELRAAYADLKFTGQRVELLLKLQNARRAEELEKERKRELPAPAPLPPRGLIEDAFVRGIVGEDRLRQLYRAYEFDAATIEAAVAVQKQRREEREAARRRAEEAGPAARPLPQATIEELHRRGLVTDERLRAYYVAVPFRADAIPDLMRRAQLRRDDYERAERLREAPPEPAVVPRATEEDAFERGIITADELAAYYRARGYSEEDVALLMELAFRRAEEQAAKLAKAQAAAIETGTSGTL